MSLSRWRAWAEWCRQDAQNPPSSRLNEGFQTPSDEETFPPVTCGLLSQPNTQMRSSPTWKRNSSPVTETGSVARLSPTSNAATANVGSGSNNWSSHAAPGCRTLTGNLPAKCWSCYTHTSVLLYDTWNTSGATREPAELPQRTVLNSKLPKLHTDSLNNEQERILSSTLCSCAAMNPHRANKCYYNVITTFLQHNPPKNVLILMWFRCENISWVLHYLV